jgi:hypothetical protein
LANENGEKIKKCLRKFYFIGRAGNFTPDKNRWQKAVFCLILNKISKLLFQEKS